MKVPWRNLVTRRFGNPSLELNPLINRLRSTTALLSGLTLLLSLIPLLTDSFYFGCHVCQHLIGILIGVEVLKALNGLPGTLLALLELLVFLGTDDYRKWFPVPLDHDCLL